MTEENTKRANQLAEEHWDYIQCVLEWHDVDSKTIFNIGNHYRAALIHGYKHAIEDMETKLTAAFSARKEAAQ